ncbi:hypothetical protein BC940DRAFT_319849 [Gongronella butleri]|nr:hypothetical protein BC940DRAFT_319849 [Gongronella butleri]
MSDKPEGKRVRQDEHDAVQGPSQAAGLKRVKLDHDIPSSPAELSLATLSLQEHAPIVSTGDYSGINQYLRQLHVERYGDPEFRERWWEHRHVSGGDSKDNGMADG